MAGKVNDGTQETDNWLYVAEFIRHHNATVGRLKVWDEAKKIAEPVAVAACEADHLEAAPKAAERRAYEIRERKWAALQRARRELGEQLDIANSAFRAQDLTQDAVDFLASAAAVVGLFLSGPAGLVVAAASTGVGIANDYLRPTAPGVPEAIDQSLGVIGTGLAADPGLARAGYGVLGSAGEAVLGVNSALSSEALRLSTTIFSKDQLLDLQSALKNISPTQIQKWWGLDKEKLKGLIDKTLAAEDEYQKAHDKWNRALQGTLAIGDYEGTCIRRRIRQIVEAIYDGPEA